MSQILKGRYRVLKTLGQGGEGEVFLAETLEAEPKTVALKRTDLPAGMEGRAASSAARLLGLRHPNLLRTLDFWVEKGKAYLVFEYIEGTDLGAWSRNRARAERLEVLASMLSALASLHEHGLMHGDLKPGNVLVTDEGRPKIIDLGLGRGIGGAAAATAGYSPPEVLRGDGLFPSSDVYGFAALAFECLFGIPAFAGDSASVIAARQMEPTALEPPPDAGPDLVRFFSRCLDPDPSKRFPTAAAALSALAEAGRFDPWVGVLRRGGVSTPRFIGQSLPLARMESALLAPGASGNKAWVVVADRSSGKSRFLEEIRARALGLSWRVVGSIGEAFRPEDLLRELASTASAEDPEEDDPGAASDALDPAALAARQANRLFQLLRRSAKASPVLLVLDDLHGSTPHERSIALYLLRSLVRYSGPGRSLLSAVCLEPGETAALTTGIRDAAGLDLAPLRVHETSDLIRSMCPGLPVPDDVGALIHAASAGSPGLAEDLFRLAAAATKGQRPDWSLSASTVEQAIQRRIQGLSPDERQVLGLLALCPSGLSRAALHVVLDDARTSSVVEDLVLAGLLREIPRAGGPLLRLSCPEASIGISTIAGRDVVDRKGLHLRIAEALRLGNAPKQEIAFHFEAGGEREAAALRYLEAGDEASWRADLATAAGCLEKGIALGGKGWPPRAEAMTGLARMLRRSGKAREALELASKAAADGEEPLSEWFAVQAELLADLGRYEEAQKIAAEAMGRGGDAPRLFLAEARAAILAGRYAEALSAVERVDPSSVGKWKGDLLHASGLALHYLQRPREALERFQEARQAFLEAGDATGLLKVAGMSGLTRQGQGDWEGALAGYEEALSVARRLGDIPREMIYLQNRATVFQILGDYRSAIQGYEESAELSRRLGNEGSQARLALNLSVLFSDLGAYEEASKTAADAWPIIASLDHQGLYSRALLASAEASAGLGEEVAARFEEARKELEEAHDPSGVLEAELDLAAWLKVRDPGRSLDLAAEVAGKARETGRDRLEGRALLVRGSVLLRESLTASPEATNLLRTARDLADKARDAETGWEARACLGLALEREGHAEEARQERDEATRRLDLLADRVPPELRPRYLARPAAQALLDLQGKGEGRLGRVAFPDRSEDLARKVKDLETLLDINHELVREHDLQRLLGLIMERAVELTGAERGLVLLPEEETLRIAVARGVDRGDEDVAQFSRSVAEQVIRSGRSLLALDALEDERFSRFLSVHALKLRSILCVPLRIRRRVEGVLYLDSRLRARVFTASDQELLEGFGVQAALALETAKLIEADRKRAAELEASKKQVEELSRKLAGDLERREAELDETHALLRQTQAEVSERMRSAGIIGRSRAIERVFQIVERVARTDVPVYLYGESGTGKELVAKAIHAEGPRSAEPFVSVNCGALPTTLLASELFGHVKGSFTGATRDKPGLFAAADGGTLFLDEVGDMEPEMQTQLLRVLQNGCYWPVGSDKERAADVRVISASNRDLDRLVEAGTFREDLYYRLNVLRIDIPPLRERADDIPLLTRHFLGKGSKEPRSIRREALKCLADHDWPGNIRELENEILRALTMAEGEIRVEDLSDRIRKPAASLRSDPASADIRGRGDIKGETEAFEKDLILRILEETQGNAAAAARRMGLSRTALYKKLQKYDLMGSLKSARR